MLIKHLWVGLKDGTVAGFWPCPFAYYPSLERVLTAYDYLVEQGNDLGAAHLAQCAINLHPRLDLPGVFGCLVEDFAPAELDRLFAGGELALLNQFSPPEVAKGETDPAPPWSSGDYLTDALADNITRLGSYGDAQALLMGCCAQRVVDLGNRLHDTQKGPENREKAALSKYFWEEWMPEADDFMPEGYFEP